MSGPNHQPGQGCPQCGSDADWGSSSWCPDCGFYPAIGKLVETPQFENEEVVYDHWWEAVPKWMWVIAAGIGVIFVTNVAIRVIFDAGSLRLFWTIGQMAIGLIAVSVCHFLAYLYGASKSDRVGPLDALLKPMGTWQPVFLGMPQTFKLICGGTWGFTAIVLGFLIVGGLDLQAMAEAHQKANAAKPKTKRTSPMAFIMKSATVVASAQGNMPGNEAPPDAMEDSLTAFTGAAGVDENGGLSFGDKDGASLTEGAGVDPDAYIEQQKKIAQSGGEAGESSSETSEVSTEGASSPNGSKTGAPSSSTGGSGHPRSYSGSGNIQRYEKIQCLVFGYTTNAQGDIRSLLVAAPMHGVLRFVAKISVDDVDPGVLQEMQNRFANLQTPHPTVMSPYGGRWLKPEIFCEVEFAGWAINGRLNEPFVTKYAVVQPKG